MSMKIMKPKKYDKKCPCKRCLNKFKEKEIYTIQQFQYRKSPSYAWTKDLFNIMEINEWDSFCEDCVMYYGKISHDIWMKYCTK